MTQQPAGYLCRGGVPDMEVAAYTTVVCLQLRPRCLPTPLPRLPRLSGNCATHTSWWPMLYQLTRTGAIRHWPASRSQMLRQSSTMQQPIPP